MKVKKVTYINQRDEFESSHIIRETIYNEIIERYGSVICWIESITNEKIKAIKVESKEIY
jgi:hypothetical protein